jgi:large subunit ribosomal protein L18
LKNIFVQVIDDTTGNTIAAASSLDKDIKAKQAYGGNKAAAKLVGELIAEKAKAKGIEEVAFDRGGFLYHGRVKELADGARKAGLKF